MLVSWGRPETTAALTVAPPAGSCPLLWHPPADLMTARGLNPLSAAGANWYWSCTVSFVYSRQNRAWSNVFSKTLKKKIWNIHLFLSLPLFPQNDTDGRLGMRSVLLNASDDGDSKRAKLSYSNRGLYSRTASTSVAGSTYSSNGLSSGRGT